MSILKSGVFVKPTHRVRRASPCVDATTCCKKSPRGDCGARWECERTKGHKGKHVAWSDYTTGETYEGGVWRTKL